MKLGGGDDIVGTGGVVDAEGGVAAIAGDQVGEGVVDTLSPRDQLPAASGRLLGLRHEDAVLAAVANGDVVKPVVTAVAHEYAQVIGGQDGVADDVVVESQVQRDTGPWVVVETESRKQAILRLVTGKAVKFVV